MSEWGSIIDALETEVRTAVSSIPAGAVGFERGLRPGQDLKTSEFPHVFAHNPTEEVVETTHGQKRVRFSVQLDLWTRGETQEQAATKLEAVRAEIEANRTLGGLVERCFIAVRSLREWPAKPERAGVIVVQAEWVR